MMIDTDNSNLDRMRLLGDREADALVSNAFLRDRQSMLYAALKVPDDQISSLPDSEFKQFLLTRQQDPEWLDNRLLIEGQRFFRKYALDIMTLLGSLSLPYCYAASPGNKAIDYTEKMRKSAGKRLVETAHFIITVTQEGSLNGITTGIVQVNKTRLIHALVRYHLSEKMQWNMAWGLPINQEDMAGTNLAFSYIILVGLKRGGFPITAREEESFLHLWRYIGYQLCIDATLLPGNMNEASQLEEAIRLRHFKPSAEGVSLTRSLIDHYEKSFPWIASFFVEAQIRYFVGPEVSKLLNLKHEPFKYRFIQWMNGLRERINKRYLNRDSYNTMIRNHYKLKEKYMPS